MNSLHLFSVPMMMGATSIHAATAFCFCQCRLGCRNCANSVVCWLLLLLYNEVFPSAYLQHFVTVVLNLTVLQTTLQLEEQCEARASSLSLLFASKIDYGNTCNTMDRKTRYAAWASIPSGLWHAFWFSGLYPLYRSPIIGRRGSSGSPCTLE